MENYAHLRKNLHKSIDNLTGVCYNGIIIKVKRKATTMKTIYKLYEERFEVKASDVESNSDIINAYNEINSHNPQEFFATEDLAEAEAEFNKCEPKVLKESTYNGITVYIVDYYALEKVTLDEDGEEVEFEMLEEKFGEVE